jgi:hypothetical protein
MSSARILFPEFRDEQRASRYPFADTATLQSSTNATIQISTDTFLDASFFAIGGGARTFISSIDIATQTITIVIGDDDLTSRLSATYNPLQPPEDGVLNFVDVYERPGGMLLSTPAALALFSSWEIGTYEFTRAQTEFVASVSIPANEPGVRALQPETKQLMTSDVWLIGDQGVVVRLDGTNIVRFDIVGVPLFERAICEPKSVDFPTKRFLKTINGCTADDSGNFTITASNRFAPDSVLRVYVDNGALVIDTAGRSIL